MKRIVLLAAMVLSALAVFAQGRQGEARAAGIANISIPFAGSFTEPEDVRALVASRIEALREAAQSAGVTAIQLQSTAYTLTSDKDGFSAEGNMFIGVVPETKSAEFVTLAGKRGVTATIEYYQSCR